MKEIWLPMDSGIVSVTLKQQNEVEVTDQMVMEKKAINMPAGFAYPIKKPKKGGK